jgi:acetyl-CoA C-acetyltransferase
VSQHSREQQDDFALESYKRAAAAWDSGKFSEEVFQLEVPQKRGAAVTVTKDQEYTAVDANKVRSVRPAFKKDGSVTAPNASTLNDGAAAMVSSASCSIHDAYTACLRVSQDFAQKQAS